MSKEYIEREAAMGAVEYVACRDKKTFSSETEYSKILQAIHGIPAVDVVEVRHGEWIEEKEYYSDDYSECNVRKVYACSLCGRTEKHQEPYCNCGAKMDGKGEC